MDAPPPEAAPVATESPAAAVVNAEVRPKLRVAPDYPQAAKALNLPDTRCTVRISIDASGTPTSVEPRHCPTVFVESAVAAASQWRFYPYIGPDGTAVPCLFDLSIVYSLKGQAPTEPPALRLGVRGAWQAPLSGAEGGPEILALIGSDDGDSTLSGVVGYRHGGVAVGFEVEARLAPAHAISPWLGAAAKVVFLETDRPVYLSSMILAGGEVRIPKGPAVQLGAGLEWRAGKAPFTEWAVEGTGSLAWSFGARSP